MTFSIPLYTPTYKEHVHPLVYGPSTLPYVDSREFSRERYSLLQLTALLLLGNS